MTNSLPYNEKDILVLERHVARYRELIRQVSDVTESKDRWGTVRPTARSLNQHCMEFETGNSCGCCDDCGIMIRPYTNVVLMTGETVKVYSNPDKFYIGTGRTYFVANNTWQDSLKKAELNQTLIDKISSYVKYEERRNEERRNEEEEDDQVPRYDCL